MSTTSLATEEAVIAEIDTNERATQETVDDESDEDVIDPVDTQLQKEAEEYLQDDDDRDEEGATPTTTTVVSFEMANSFRFFDLCSRLEQLWSYKKASKGSKPPPPLERKLQYLLPPTMLADLDSRTDPPESIFPILRLLIPEKDTTRRWHLKESTLAEAYGQALGLHKTAMAYRKLVEFTNPAIVGTTGVGDFSVVVQQVLEDRISSTGSTYTIGQINAALDELSKIRPKFHPTTHKKITKKMQQIEWLRRLIALQSGDRGLSPLEHKWMVRVMQQRLQFGVGWKRLMEWYHPAAPSLWDGHNSLEHVLRKIALGGIPDGIDEVDWTGVQSYLPPSQAEIKFDHAFTPMKSERTAFDRLLDNISHRHRDFADQEGDGMIANSLNFRHPPFTVETKLDGERMVLHISRTGVVKMHTRSANWYSDWYTPVLGPAVRRAVGHHGFDIILDGEVLGWDNARKETIPFGNNRTIANLRKEFLKAQGTLDQRDLTIQHRQEANVIRPGAGFSSGGGEEEELAGRECWLHFVAFDVVYVDGPGAAEFLDNAVAADVSPRPSPGPLTALSGMERKKILYRLMIPQVNEVEIVSTQVIRPDGQSVIGSEYFDPIDPTIEEGHPAHLLDTVQCAYNNTIPNMVELDFERRRERSEEEISQARARAVELIYRDTVDERCEEGLMFKDLSSPYIAGLESKEKRYWLKFKPDFFNGSAASDLDLVIIGSYFATGLRNSGKPSSFICACLDSEDSEGFMPFTKVNAGSLEGKQYDEVLALTGFGTDDNKWYRLPDGAHGKEYPNFISRKSHVETDGWVARGQDYPDLWIHPKDAPILTLNAGEIVPSRAFSAGLTLRFPRVTKYRARGTGDEKPMSECENDDELWKTYNDVIESRKGSGGSNAAVVGSQMSSSEDTSCRFLTESQYRVSRTKKSTRLKETVTAIQVPEVQTQESIALRGLSFNVLNGTYTIDGADVEEGKEEGWLDEAMAVSSSSAVRAFIKKHGGTTKISADDNSTMVLGGRRGDAKVAVHIRAIETAQAQLPRILGKKTKTQREKKLEKMAEVQGVLRWTYVYSLVQRWCSITGPAESNAQSIVDTDPDFAKPTALDFLARPVLHGSHPFEDLCSVEFKNVSMIRRALGSVAQVRPQKRPRKNELSDNPLQRSGSWQIEAIRGLAENERWILKTERAVLWPGGRDGTDPVELVTVYPDIFDEGLGSIVADDTKEVERWDRVEAHASIEPLLPLLRTMGAVVTSNLNNRVTHVLACLREGSSEEIAYTDHVQEDVFENPSKGRRLLRRLRTLAASHQASRSVILVSPSWVRNRTWYRAD